MPGTAVDRAFDDARVVRRVAVLFCGAASSAWSVLFGSASSSVDSALAFRTTKESSQLVGAIKSESITCDLGVAGVGVSLRVVVVHVHNQIASGIRLVDHRRLGGGGRLLFFLVVGADCGRQLRLLKRKVWGKVVEVHSD